MSRRDGGCVGSSVSIRDSETRRKHPHSGNRLLHRFVKSTRTHEPIAHNTICKYSIEIACCTNTWIVRMTSRLNVGKQECNGMIDRILPKVLGHDIFRSNTTSLEPTNRSIHSNSFGHFLSFSVSIGIPLCMECLIGYNKNVVLCWYP